ncbi:MAG: TrkH family potassium uptake protein [Bacilli bacterium]|nr:TrkH family potassium uptake protein [Bacilli bacterium]
MNYTSIKNILGKIMVLLAFLMFLPIIVCLCEDESERNLISFLIPITLLFVIGKLLMVKKAENNSLLPREGFIIVALSWIIMSLFGCLPFIISGEIPNFIDAFFEITSGFTTTGSSILNDPSKLSKSMMFWRSFSHWIGGMGILVFILAIIPESKDGSAMYILRAESPGPQVGKLVSKMRVTSRILYLIYVFLTVLQVLILWLGPDAKMDFFNSLIYTFGTAGTGGLGVDVGSLETYTAYSQYVIAVFMLIFGINFSLFYLILIGNFKEVFKNQEVKLYFIIVIISILIVFLNIYNNYATTEEAFRHAFFQVSSIITTTGYSTTNFADSSLFPSMAQMVLIFLMLFGACAGSTGGGIKISRINILFRSILKKIKNMVSPRKVEVLIIDGNKTDEEMVNSVHTFLVVYMIVLFAVAFIISIDGYDFTTNFSASLACLSNIGPGLGKVGPYENFNGFSYFSKFILSLEMITGRLELFPMLILFSPKTWKKRV